MKRLIQIRSAISLLGGLCWFSATLPAHGATAKPNFVIIFIDDLGFGDIGPFGATKQKTPRLDRMAAEGMKFTSFYAAPVCSVSRAQLLTGCYGVRVSVPGVFGPASKQGLHPKEFTIAERLKEHGYATACFGKWHVGDQPEFLPTRQGFDRYVGIPYSNDMQRKSTVTGERVVPLVRDEQVVELLTDEAQRQVVERYTDEAVKFIRESKDQPFLLYLPHTAVHTPIFPGQAFRGKSANGRFGDWVEEVDWSVGRVLDTLRELKLAENTLVIFTSDNGPWLIKGPDSGSAWPLRGGKGSTWEGGVRVPTIAWWPGKIKPGSVCDTVAGTIDLLPTFVSLAGGKVPAEPVIDGRDISPLLFGQSKQSPREAHYYFRGNTLEAVRQGPWKLTLAAQPETMGKGVLEDAKVTPRLYNLDTEINEQTNLADQHPEIVAKLQSLAAKMNAEIGGPFPAARRPTGVVEKPVTLYPSEAPAPKQQPAPKPQKKKANRPNIVLFLADDLGYGDLACYGHPMIKTPNLDAFAKEGVRLTHCYSASAVCSPSRSALLTGRTPHRNGVFTWIAEGAEVHLRTSEITLPKLLQSAGYTTCHSGKWHLNGFFNDPRHPQPGDHGYDWWLATQNNAVPSHQNPRNFVRNGQPVGPLEGYSAPLVVTDAIQWLKDRRDASKPFFLAVWTHEPHYPIKSDPKFKALYPELTDDVQKEHHANVTQMDDAFGQLMWALDELQLAENTFVFFTSDNGPEGDGIKTPGRGSSGGLRGRKRDLHEGGIRVPGLARWPNRIQPGATSDVPVIGSDVFSTLLAVAGTGAPKDRVLDGVNVLPVLTGAADRVDRPQPLYWRLHMASNAKIALRVDDWKILANAQLTEFELYNLRADPKESTDLKNQEPERFAALRTQLIRHNAAVETEGPDGWKRLNPNGGQAPKAKPSADKPVKVFILAGQSNMEGHGLIAADPKRNGGKGSLEQLTKDPATAARFQHLVAADGQWAERNDVWISYLERNGRLKAGFGARPDRIGPELGFGWVVGDALSDPVLLIKTAWGGRSLAVDFRPPSAGKIPYALAPKPQAALEGDPSIMGKAYREILTQVRAVLADGPKRFPKLAGRQFELAGFGWHQGWNDRINDAFNAEYASNLAHFIRDVRRELNTPKLPFVIVETGMSGPGETHPRAVSLMEAQASVATLPEFRDNVAFVGTREFWRSPEASPTNQGYHWNSNAETYYLLGEAMGRAMLRLCNQFTP